jgi:hypothetical protein
VVLYTPLAGLFDVYAPAVPGLARIAVGVVVVVVLNYALSIVLDRVV